MSKDSDIVSASPPTWGAMWAAAIAGGVVAGIGLLVRLALLRDVSPLEDSILRSLQEHGVSLALRPGWTEPLVGLIEAAGFAALGAGIGWVAAVLHWSAMRAACVTVVIVALMQTLCGLLPRVPL
jgi:hypothetical protein